MRILLPSLWTRKGLCKSIKIDGNICKGKDWGGMAEWFKAAVLKTASRKSGTWVRILLPPPDYAKASSGRPFYLADGAPKERSGPLKLRMASHALQRMSYKLAVKSLETKLKSGEVAPNS